MLPSLSDFFVLWPLRALGLACCIASLAACDAQVSPEYVGQPLLLMKGSVEFSGNVSGSMLEPALAFYDIDTAEIQIADVETEGEFPAQFTLRVYEPPSDEVLRRIANLEASAAIAFITAVTPSHPDKMDFTTDTNITVHPSTCNDGPCECPASGCVRSETELCTHDRARCYTATVTCPRSDSPEEDCTTSYSGDASLGDSPWESFAGLSENYVVVYVTEALPARTPWAMSLGIRAALERGYNLLAIRPLTDEESAAQYECVDAANEAALERFNLEHGTNYDEFQILGLTCGPGAGPEADCPPGASEEEAVAYNALADQVLAERGCLTTAFETLPVEDPAHESITVRIGPGLDPLSQANADAPSEPMSPPTPEAPQAP